MPLAQQHFILTGAPLNLARMRSCSRRVFEAMPDMVLGNSRLHEVYFIDDDGGNESFSGASYATLGVRVGQQGASALFSATAITAITNGWQFTLPVTANATTACLVEFSVAVTAGKQTFAVLPVALIDPIS